MTRTPPTVTDHDRLLRLLEANLAHAREPELIKRLRAAIHEIQNSRGTTTDRANKEAGTGLHHGHGR